MNRPRWNILAVGLAIIGLTALSTHAQTSRIAGTPAMLGKYLQSGSAASFVSAGVSAFDDCTVPLEFRETQKQALQILEILCTGGTEDRFARLTFIRLTDAQGRAGLSPFRIEFIP